LDINHPDRMIVGVASGTITLQDLETFLADLVKSGTLRYRKIIDLAGCTLLIDQEQMATFVARVLAARQGMPRGPLAIVAHDKQGDVARLFATLTGADRPAEVFRSIHDARKWLADNTTLPP
jgi:hypothetical protein